MTIVAISLRVDHFPERSEVRDALQQEWSNVFNALEIMPLMLPNNRDLAIKMVKSIKPTGLILSGGGNINQLGGTDHERSAVEKATTNFMSSHGYPVLGICRGMQFLLSNYSSEETIFENSSTHVGQRHLITDRHTHQSRSVNSFHDIVVTSVSSDWVVHSISEDKTIEQVSHSRLNLHGIMWHPEREEQIANDDLILLKKIIVGK